ncbi:MAG: lipoate--protein ligase family protein [Planctomycetales bacterium]
MAHNIALDEALLLSAERQPAGGGYLRIWEPSSPLVVVGRGSDVSVEVNLQQCRQEQVPVLRRSSGGAAIVASRGCLMYAVVLPYSQHPQLRAIDQAHHFVLDKFATTLADALPGLQREGISDLAQYGRKVSGNSLRCRKDWLLYHGTFLYDMNLEMVGKYLLNPPRQPDYRAGREHFEFISNMDISRDRLRDAVVSAWDGERIDDWPEALTHQLVAEKYSQPEWNLLVG